MTNVVIVRAQAGAVDDDFVFGRGEGASVFSVIRAMPALPLPEISGP